jgi:transcription-repair coupling factor (superfamily II helicase)
LRRLAEEIGVISIDKTPGGIAVKLSEKARVAPEKLLAIMAERTGAGFSPSGVLRLELDEEETDYVLETARRVLLEVRAAD